MKHVCYHILSDLHNEFFDTIDEVKQSAANWQNEGDDHFKVFKISTEDSDSDEIILDEELIILEEIRKN